MREKTAAKMVDNFPRTKFGVFRMAVRNQGFKEKRFRFDEGRKSKFAIETFFKCVMRVADFAFPQIVMVIAVLPEILNQVTHRMKRMAKYREQYCQADEEGCDPFHNLGFKI